MLLDQELHRIFSDLAHHAEAVVEMGGQSITLQVFDHGTKILLTTPVFSGGQYIPQSVRHCVGEGFQIGDTSIRTFLKIDEQNFRVLLHYLGVLSTLNEARARALLEEFHWIAEEWRLILDERGRRDLIHVPTH